MISPSRTARRRTAPSHETAVRLYEAVEALGDDELRRRWAEVAAVRRARSRLLLERELEARFGRKV